MRNSTYIQADPEKTLSEEDLFGTIKKYDPKNEWFLPSNLRVAQTLEESGSAEHKLLGVLHDLSVTYNDFLRDSDTVMTDVEERDVVMEDVDDHRIVRCTDTEYEISEDDAKRYAMAHLASVARMQEQFSPIRSDVFVAQSNDEESDRAIGAADAEMTDVESQNSFVESLWQSRSELDRMIRELNKMSQAQMGVHIPLGTPADLSSLPGAPNESVVRAVIAFNAIMRGMSVRI